MNNFLQTVIGAILSGGFLIVLAIVAWHIAIPLLLILLAVVLFGILRMRYLIHKTAQRVADATEPLGHAKRNPTPTENVIDVEYTEV